VEVFHDSNENRSLDPGEIKLTESLDGCPEVVWGGTVKASGQSVLDSGQEFHYEVDAHSGPRGEDPGGSVIERIGESEIRGTVTCLRVDERTASMGVALENPPPGTPRGQFWTLWDPPPDFPIWPGGLISITAVDVAPSDCTHPPDGQHLLQGRDISNGTIDVQQAGDDTAPPTLHVPEEFTVNATSPLGARARYRVSVSDDLDLTPEYECSPPSGTVFPIGTTTVHCTARDSAGHEAAADFPVRVRGGREQLTDLKALVVELGIEAATARRLRAKLDKALSAVDGGRVRKACAHLRDTARVVRRKAGGKLTPLQAGRLDYELARIRSVLQCTPPQPPATEPRIVLAPVCDSPAGPYGIVGRLEGFPPNADVLSSVTMAPFPSGLLLSTPTDAAGSSDEVSYADDEPLGRVGVTSWLTNGVVLATATLENPCLLERRRGRRN
jgi:hypothetical protein